MTKLWCQKRPPDELHLDTCLWSVPRSRTTTLPALAWWKIKKHHQKRKTLQTSTQKAIPIFPTCWLEWLLLCLLNVLQHLTTYRVSTKLSRSPARAHLQTHPLQLSSCAGVQGISLGVSYCVMTWTIFCPELVGLTLADKFHAHVWCLVSPSSQEKPARICFLVTSSPKAGLRRVEEGAEAATSPMPLPNAQTSCHSWQLNVTKHTKQTRTHDTQQQPHTTTTRQQRHNTTSPPPQQHNDNKTRQQQHNNNNNNNNNTHNNNNTNNNTTTTNNNNNNATHNNNQTTTQQQDNNNTHDNNTTTQQSLFVSLCLSLSLSPFVVVDQYQHTPTHTPTPTHCTPMTHTQRTTHKRTNAQHTTQNTQGGIASSAYQNLTTWGHHLTPEVHQRTPWILHVFQFENRSTTTCSRFLQSFAFPDRVVQLQFS